MSDRALTAVSKMLADYPAASNNHDSVFVISLLLARVLNDQHVCVVTAAKGYPLQAVSIAAGMLELANAAAFIGNDEARAAAWLSHEDVAHTYPPNVRASIHATCELLGLDEVAEEKEYKDYRHLCMAKHSNPIAMSQLGLEMQGGRIRIHLGPYYDEGVLRATRSAIAAATRASWLGARVFVHYHVPTPSQATILSDLAPIGQEMLRLVARDGV